MFCPERLRLLDEYTAATSSLIDLVHEIHLKTGAEFREALAEAAHTASDKAWRALMDHRLEHN